MKKILFIGPPGCGKGTQAQLLQTFGLAHISTGELMRQAFRKKDPLVIKYKANIDQGNFLPDHIVFTLIKRGIKHLQSKKGYILDGAVRNLNQANIALQKKLFDTVLFFDLPKEISLKRIEKRKYSNIKRKDDNEAAVQKRFAIYEKQTAPVKTFLQKKVKKFYLIDATPTPKRINKKVLEILDLRKNL